MYPHLYKTSSVELFVQDWVTIIPCYWNIHNSYTTTLCCSILSSLQWGIIIIFHSLHEPQTHLDHHRDQPGQDHLLGQVLGQLQGGVRKLKTLITWRKGWDHSEGYLSVWYVIPISSRHSNINIVRILKNNCEKYVLTLFNNLPGLARMWSYQLCRNFGWILVPSNPHPVETWE